jgi:dihydroxy-acid dehydratase
MSYRSSIFGKKHMAGARALWGATGGYKTDKPIIAVVNSFCEFVPGHVHLRDVGKIISQEIESLGANAKEFNTIALDDGIAMGHDGMLYSLPSREVITDSIEYMINGHKVDGMICISNCDKITPGMLNAAMRLNIPSVFVSGGPMEAGILKSKNNKEIDLVDVIVIAAHPNATKEEIEEYEKSACPTCGSCSGMFTANSMNCLTEALGLALPGNGSVLATHSNRKKLFIDAARLIVDITNKYYIENNESVLPRNVVSRQSVLNAMALDIAMGGSTNTILHLLACCYEGEVDFSLKDIDMLSKIVPTLCKIAPASNYHMQDFHKAGGVMKVMDILLESKLIDGTVKGIDQLTLQERIEKFSIRRSKDQEVIKFYKSAPSGKNIPYASNTYHLSLDSDIQNGCIRSFDYAYCKDGGLAVLYGNIATQGSIVKVAAVDESLFYFKGKAIVCESQDEAVEKILSNQVKENSVVVIRYEGPKGGPGMQEMLYPTSHLKSMQLDKKCALITDGRFSGGTAGLSIGHVSPEAAEGGLIAIIEDGDEIEIDIRKRSINVLLNKEEIERRINTTNFKPKNRNRIISKSLQRYAKNVLNSSYGAAMMKI